MSHIFVLDKQKKTDEFSWSDYRCNGVTCVVCNKKICVHCCKNWDKETCEVLKYLPGFQRKDLRGDKYQGRYVVKFETKNLEFELPCRFMKKGNAVKYAKVLAERYRDVSWSVVEVYTGYYENIS